MSFNPLDPRWLLQLLLVGACTEPGTKAESNAAASAPELLIRVDDSITVPASSREQLPDPIRSPALTEPIPPKPGTAGAQVRFVAAHPRGAWRLADPGAIASVTLWADQILIRHEGARNEVSFYLGYWLSVAPSVRTREQALSLAERVAAEAARQPLAFPELARLYSDDLPSRDEGGELGGLSANHLSAWPQVLDALEATRPGQTSNVVETHYGFHIFRRRSPPPERTLTGLHIVIGHDQAEWLKVQGRGPLPSRKRDEAFALAGHLYERARAQPERFRELVDQHSEHRDAVLGGELGSWSNCEPNPFPFRMRRLEQLSVGEVGAPVETHLGVEVIMRTEDQPPEQYAMLAARLPFDPEAPDADDTSRASVLARAEALARKYSASPNLFGAPGELPIAPLQWQSGRGVPGVELQLESLEFGAVADTPVQAELSFQISKRVPPGPVTRLRCVTELPASPHPDLAYHSSEISPESFRELLRQVQLSAETELHLPSPWLGSLRNLHQAAALSDAQSEARRAEVEILLEKAGAILGKDAYARYRAVFERELRAAVLGAGADSLAERGI